LVGKLLIDVRQLDQHRLEPAAGGTMPEVHQRPQQLVAGGPERGISIHQ